MSDLIGKTIGQYQIIEQISANEFALVYKGFDPKLSRYVAVKVLTPAQAQDPSVVEAFNQYAELAASIQHPNILPVFDSGQENGLYCLVTPFMEKGSIADNLIAYTNPQQVVDLIHALLPGLQAIYQQGYIHGNLEPNNILLNAQGLPLLSDFAVNFRKSKQPTPYNSPEQVQGGPVDSRTDVYALGIIVYQLLVGKAPVPGAALNLQSARPDVPKNLEQVILKATAQNPDQRYQTPGEFQNALVDAMQLTSQPPAPTPTPQLSPSPAPERRGINWTGIVVGGILVVLLCILAVMVGPQLMNSLNPDTEPPQPVADQPIQPPASEPDQPVVEPPQDEAPPEADQPPSEDGNDSSQPVCGGSLGILGGFVFMGGALFRKRRYRDRFEEAK
jgi:serine/threonine protein kinase